MYSRILRAGLTIAVWAVLSLTARPAPAAEDAAASAREHYQKGTAFYDLGKYDEAIKEFEAAYEIKNDPALLYNLAQSYRLAGNAEQALHFYRTYLRRVPKVANRAEIEERITALEQQVAQKNAAGTTPPAAAPPGTTTPPPPAPPAGETPPPGPGTPPAATPPTTTPTPTMTPPPAAGTFPPAEITTVTAPPPPAPAPAAEHARKLKLAAAITAGGGGALVLIGAIEGARAVGAANEINNAAKAGKAYDPAVETRGLNAQSAERSLLIIGFLALAAGGGLYYYGWHSEHTSAQVAVTPVASAHGAGALFQVTY